MKINIKKIGIGISAALILIGGRYGFSEAGSQSDPLVSLTYVEKKLDEMRIEIKEYVNEKIVKEENTNVKQGDWEIVNVAKGQSLIGKGGTELILRSGKAAAITKISRGISNGRDIIVENGLADITDGEDLKMGANIPLEHMLLIPRDDGRGVSCTIDSIFMVKGDYTISR